ncbi:MAG: FlgO family outer membrane protein [Nitrospinota bacterium]
MKLFRVIGLVISAAVLAVSCQSNPYYESSLTDAVQEKVPAQAAQPQVEVAAPAQIDPVKDISAREFRTEIKNLAGQVKDNLNEYELMDSSLVVTTFVDANSLSTSSAFGQYITEQLIFELHNLDYRVFEMRQAEKIEIIDEKGEFYLTRTAEKLLNRYRSDVVIVGTYSVFDGEVTIHARALDRDSSRIISVASISLEFDKFPMVVGLLKKIKSGADMEQVYIKRLED